MVLVLEFYKIESDDKQNIEPFIWPQILKKLLLRVILVI